MKKILSGLIKLYQVTFGVILGPCCRFYPSCSEYAAEVLQTQRIHYAVWLILKRLLKCQPLCKGGIDPVPPRRKFNK